MSLQWAVLPDREDKFLLGIFRCSDESSDTQIPPHLSVCVCVCVCVCVRTHACMHMLRMLQRVSAILYHSLILSTTNPAP
jgi:hypothetical protein